MPVKVRTTIRRLEEAEFRRIVFDVMHFVFEIHNEFGRFFDEKIYKRELGQRYPGAELEVPLEVHFESFRKLYYLDALVGGGALFEFKTVDSLVNRHRSQLLHYLLMLELPHGKLVNLRSEHVQHEFVNTRLTLSDRTKFEVGNQEWQEIGTVPIQMWFLDFLRDVGTRLDITLYEDALTHLLGGEERALQEVAVLSGGKILGSQKCHLVEPNVAFKVTALREDLQPFVIHARRLLDHTSLTVIQWINVTQNEVTFRTIRK